MIFDYPSGRDISNESEVYNIIKELRKRSFSEEDLNKIAFKNFYRVFKETWK